MPARHEIDNNMKLITTTWSGEATDRDLITALLKYQQDIKSQPDYASYNEIVDFSNVIDFQLSTEGIKNLVQTAAKTDVQQIKTKLAIIVSLPIAYGLGRMYEAYRTLTSRQSKEVRVFKNYRDALEWIYNAYNSDTAG
jgi:hypothetical protein